MKRLSSWYQDASGSATRARTYARLWTTGLLGFSLLACTRDSVERASVDQFSARRPALDTLKATSDEDSLLVRIAPDFIDPIIVPSMPTPRLERYRELFKRVQSDAGLVRHVDGSVLVFAGKSGILDIGATYLYVYFTIAPSPSEVLPQLSTAPPGSRFYRSLGGNWYLQQDR